MRQRFAIFDPDTWSWKTPTYFLFGGLTPYSETWPDSGIMLHGVASERSTWEPRIDAGGLSSSHGAPWPTPTAGDASASGGRSKVTTGRTHAGTSLTDAVRKTWPTPTASDHKGSTGKGSRRGTTAEAVHPLTEHGQTGATLYPHPTFVEWLMGFPAGWVTARPCSPSPGRISIATDVPPCELSVMPSCQP